MMSIFTLELIYEIKAVPKQKTTVKIKILTQVS